MEDKGFQFRNGPETNRANDLKDNGQTLLIPSITIYDIDYAILWQLKTGFKLRIQDNGNSVEVPTIMASPEKWVQIRKFGYLRGNDNKLLAPLIVLNRTNIDEDETFSQLDVPNNQKLYYLAPKQTADRFNNLNATDNTNKSLEYIVATIPEPVKVTYELVVWCNMQTQLNYIIEQIIPNDKIPWGDQLQFVTKINGWSFETVNEPGADRVVKASTTLVVNGMLQNQHTILQSDVSSSFSIKRVDFKNEYEENNFTVDYRPEIIKAQRPKIRPENFTS